MGIENIRILTQPNLTPDPNLRAIQAQQAHEAQLKDAHRRGDHPYGYMRRDCPLCQLGK